MTLQELLDLYGSLSPQEFFGQVSEPDIVAAEKTLGIQLPRQYRAFVSSMGSGSVSSEAFLGLCGDPHLDIVRLTQHLRAKTSGRCFPATLIPVRFDGFGNYDCIDVARPTEDGECAIVEWIHGGISTDPNRVLATSYLEWFRSILEMISEIESS